MINKFIISAPGKIILHGEHSVVYNKLAIASSLDLRTNFKYEKIVGDVIEINLPNIDITAIYPLNEILRLFKKVPEIDYKHPGNAAHSLLLDIVVNFIKNNKCDIHLTPVFYLMAALLQNIEITPFRITVDTKLNIGAGMGSSASYCVVLAAGFLYNRTLKAFDEQDLRIIDQWAYNAEKINHGLPSGIDNTICTYGGWVEYRKNQPPNIYKLNTTMKIILIDTKISRNTKKQVEKVVKLKGNFPKVIDNILAAMDETSLSASQLIKNIENGIQVEDQYKHLQDLTTINQKLLNSLNVGHEKLDHACALLAKYNLAGKLTGAGGGGCAICYVPPNFPKETLMKIIREFEENNFGAVLINLGSPGVKIDSFL